MSALTDLVLRADGRHRERKKVDLDPAVFVAVGSLLLCVIVGCVGTLVA